MIPDIAVNLAKHFEGFSTTPYLCPANFWTIGYGHLCDKDHPEITLEQGEAYLRADMQDAYDAVVRYCPVLLEESDARLGAIVDFTFNLGGGRLQTSTLRRRINDKLWDEATYELKRWIYGGGRILPGLVRRREWEALFMYLG